MNRPTQITLFGIFAATLSASFILKYILRAKEQQAKQLAQLDQFVLTPSEQTAVGQEQVKAAEQKQETEISEPVIAKNNPLPTASILETRGDDFPLRLGSEGPKVIRLQVWLMRNFGWQGKLSGVLDQLTLQRMKKHLKTESLDEKTYYKHQMDRPIQQQKIIR